MKLCLNELLVLGAIFAIAAAGPISDSESMLKTMISEALNQELISEAATYSRCLRHAHSIKYYLNKYDYTFKYRACLSGGYLCYDATQSLPEECPQTLYGSPFRPDDCVDITWVFLGKKHNFQICDYFGKPCQTPVVYSITKPGYTHVILRSTQDKSRVCPPNPKIYIRKPKQPYYSNGGEMQEWHAKAAVSIRLCEEENGNDEGCKEVPNVMVTEQEQPPAEGDDCFCMKHVNGPKVCTGKCSK